MLTRSGSYFILPRRDRASRGIHNGFFSLREHIKWNAPDLTPKPKLVYGNVNDEETLQNLPDDIDCCYLDGQRGIAKISKEYPHMFVYVAKLKAFSWTFCCTRGCSDIHETCDEFSEKMKESYKSINQNDFALIPYDSSYDGRAPRLGICRQVPHSEEQVPIPY
mmetsp:Transcript_9570/g.28060  ORF Transcript_9570/g.28060 Transcript_9570/m.28060 type:complete len:164 (+) Transcript_9570:1210-1701(+)